MRILVVAAHPDDEVLGGGGTLSRLSKEGNAVHILILGEGITSRYDRRDQAASSETEALHRAAGKAADAMGTGHVHFFDLPDNRFDTVPLLDVVKVVEGFVEQVQPSTIYTHHQGDLNVDHVITHRAVMTAVRPVNDCSVRDVYAFEVASSSEWAFQQFQPVFKPNVFVDISETIDAKIRALECYDSEIRPFPHPRSPEALRIAARHWGSVVGVEYAEAFELIRSIR